MAVRDYFFKRAEKIDPSVEVWDSHSVKEQGVIDYTRKEDRSERITYDALGKNLYSTGIPPTIYTNPLKAFTNYPIVASVVTAISDAGSCMGIKVYETTSGTQTEVADHPFYSLFSRPNSYQGSFEFLEQVFQSLDIFGNCFISKEKVAGSYELYVLNPVYMGIIPDPKIKIKQYNYYINGQSVPYKPEEIIHIKYNDPSSTYFGLPPLACAANILKFEESRLTFSTQFFVNGAVPVGVIETDSVLGEPVLKLIRGSWENLHKGVSNSHKVAILQGGLKYKPITSPIREMDFPGLKKMSRDDILSIYKVPASILGNQEGTGASEGTAAITAFWRQAIIPRLNRIQSALNRGLSEEIFGKGSYTFSFNLTDVQALNDSKTDVATYLSTMVSSSILTVNEARKVVGMPASTDPFADSILVSNSQFGNALMPISEVGNQGAGSTATKPGTTPSGTTPVKPSAPVKPVPTKPAVKPVAKP